MKTKEDEAREPAQGGKAVSSPFQQYNLDQTEQKKTSLVLTTRYLCCCQCRHTSFQLVETMRCPYIVSVSEHFLALASPCKRGQNLQVQKPETGQCKSQKGLKWTTASHEKPNAPAEWQADRAGFEASNGATKDIHFT